MSMNTLKDLVEAIKTRSKTIVETTSGSIAGSTANDMVYIGKAVEAITGADALLQLFDETNEPSKLLDYAAATSGVWTLTIEDVGKPVIKLTQASVPSESELSIVCPNRAFTTVIRNTTTKPVRVKYSGGINANTAVILAGKTGWVVGDYAAAGTAQVSHVVDVEAITAALGTVTTTGGDMIYRAAPPASTSFTIRVRKFVQSGTDYFQFKLPSDVYYRSDISFNIWESKIYVFDVADSSMTNHILKFSTTKDGTHASPAGTELLDIAPTDSTNDITYTGTAGNSGALVTITMPASVTADVIYPYCATHAGMGKNSQFNMTTASGEVRLPIGGIGTALTSQGPSGKPVWDYIGRVSAFHYRLDMDLGCRVADPRSPGYPGTEGNGYVRDDFSLQKEISDVTNFPLHANKGIYPNALAPYDSGPYYGGSCVIQTSDMAHKTMNLWGGSSNYCLGNMRNYPRPTWHPTMYRDQTKGFDQAYVDEQNTNIVQVTRSHNSSYCLDDRGQMWSCGYNGYKQLGDGTTTNQYRWIPVAMPSAASAITQYAIGEGAGNNVTVMALDDTGKVWAWGYNAQNQITSSNVTAQGIPQENTGLAGKDIKAIAVNSSDYPTCYALSGASDGYKLYSWGYNSYGQCGNGTTTHVQAGSPHQMAAGSNKKIAVFQAGGYGSYGQCLILNEDGALYFTGYNSTSQAGNGNASGNVTTPTLVSTFNTSTAGLKVLDMWMTHCHLSSGWATTDNGDFYKWGPNGSGQTAMGTVTGSQSTPAKDANLTWVSKVVGNSSGGGYYNQSIAICHANEDDWDNKINGSIYVTGYNNFANPVFGTTAGVQLTSWTPVPLPNGYQGKIRDVMPMGHSTSSSQYGGWGVLMMDGTMWTNGMENLTFYIAGRMTNYYTTASYGPTQDGHHLQLRGYY